ncbi:hypothetical protein WOLCODRAFT_150574 [Wolfiporia cocos MD-104 SS10]|uniref:Uncharacterized protein n=1 Tax=Wolfiporia cocos (strain MD-104) TaxID=742152 RepID=A0A2H3JNZ4_WOLCO|nr:hypothetical protein WOLCODRAFT_150574 [Wolfiporia cocos MD-104 SS10]
MSDNQLMNTANRMIACAVAALRAAPESMEGEDYTQWQTKFMEELAFNMGNFPYKVFELGYRLPELYGSMVAEYTQVRNDGEEFNKIHVHEGDARIASIQNLAPTVDPTRPLPVVEDLGPNQWWTADNTLAEAEGSSTAQPATRKRGREDSEEESTEKEGGKDGGLGGDEEEGTGRGGSEDEEQGRESSREPRDSREQSREPRDSHEPSHEPRDRCERSRGPRDSHKKSRETRNSREPGRKSRDTTTSTTVVSQTWSKSGTRPPKRQRPIHRSPSTARQSSGSESDSLPPARHSRSKGSNKGKGKKASKASGLKVPKPRPKFSDEAKRSDSTNRMHYRHQYTGKM